MAISYPRTDIMSAVRWSDASSPLTLMERQEQSRTAGGITIGKDLGPALWMASLATAALTQAQALAFEAMLNSLDGVIQSFEVGDMRCAAQYLLDYPTGNYADTGSLKTVNANNKALSLKGLPAGLKISAGSYLSFDYGTSRALHQIMESTTADGSGNTSEFDVRPFIRPGWTISPTTAVKLKNPRGIFKLLPGSVSSKMQGGANCVVSFQAVQYLS
jgi:hypothetical protein